MNCYCNKKKAHSAQERLLEGGSDSSDVSFDHKQPKASQKVDFEKDDYVATDVEGVKLFEEPERNIKVSVTKSRIY